MPDGLLATFQAFSKDVYTFEYREINSGTQSEGSILTRPLTTTVAFELISATAGVLL